MVSISTEKETKTGKTVLPPKRYREASGIFATLKALLAAAGVTLTQPDNVIFGRRWLAIRGQMVEIARAARVPLDDVLARVADPLAACVRAGGGLVQFAENWLAGSYAALMPAPTSWGWGKGKAAGGGRVAPREIEDGGSAAHDPRGSAAVLAELAAVKVARPETREAAVGGLRALFHAKGWQMGAAA